MICRCSNLPVYCLLNVVLSVLSAVLSKNLILPAYEPKPDGTEVIGGRFWTFKEIEDNLGKSVLTPNFEGEFARIRGALESLL